MPLWAIMALIGAGKSLTIDKAREERDRKLAAETQRWSPWTGLKAGPIATADPFGSALQWGTMGLAMDNNNKQQEYMDAMTDRIKSGGSVLGYGKAIPEAGHSSFPRLQTVQPGDSWWNHVGGRPLDATSPFYDRLKSPIGY